VAKTSNELQNITFAKGFEIITDLEVGPDGYLYVLADHDRDGTIFKINRVDNSTYPDI
jgi:glucose/arabinose dehydrogenase